jgi:hypothetical protein
VAHVRSSRPAGKSRRRRSLGLRGLLQGNRCERHTVIEVVDLIAPIGDEIPPIVSTPGGLASSRVARAAALIGDSPCYERVGNLSR